VWAKKKLTAGQLALIGLFPRKRSFVYISRKLVLRPWEAVSVCILPVQLGVTGGAGCL